MLDKTNQMRCAPSVDWTSLDIDLARSGPEVIKLFSCLTQMSIKLILLINVKMPTIVGILTFISMINTTSERLEARLFFSILVFMSS